MKLVLLVLALIGFCFDVNGSCDCCCCKNGCGSGRGKGNGGNGLEGSKGPGGKWLGSGSGKEDGEKSKDEVVGKDDGGNKSKGRKDGSKKGGDVRLLRRIIINEDVSRITIVCDKENVQLGDGDLLVGNDAKILVYEWFVNGNHIGKGKCVRIYKMPVLKIELDKVTVEGVDKIVAPYLISIGLVNDSKYYLMVCIGKDNVTFDNLFNRVSLSKLWILSSAGITDMNNMFASSVHLSDIRFLSFDTSKVTNMASMFYGCVNLESLDLRGFDTSKVTDMTRMFYNCKKLKDLRLGDKFKSDNVKTISDMFYGCNVERLNLNKFDISKFEKKAEPEDKSEDESEEA